MLDDINLLEYFNKELNRLEDIHKELYALSNEAKEHLDEVKESRSRGSLLFISQQTSNLINLKNSTLNCIKEMANIKKVSLDLLIKKEKEKSNEEDGKDQAIIKNLIKVLTDDNEDIDYENDEDDYETKSSDIDNKLESRIKKMKKAGKIEFTDNERNTKYEKLNIKIIIHKQGKKWKFVAVDELGKKYSNYPLLPKKEKCKIKFIKEEIDGKIKTIAIDEYNDNKLYEVKIIKKKK